MTFDEVTLLAKRSATYAIENPDDNNGPIHTSQVSSGIRKASCGNGFSDDYDKPASQGGKYVRRTDLNKLMYLGYAHSFMKAIGCTNTYNQTIVADCGGTYKGAVVCDSDGRKYISRKENNSSPLTDTMAWKRFVGTVGFKMGPSIYYGMTIPGEHLLKIPSTSFGDSRFLFMKFDVGVNKHGGSVFTFPGLWRRHSGSPSIVPLCVHQTSGGSEYENSWFRLLLSPYKDVYENSDHKDSFITVYQQNHWYFKKSMPIALKNGTYYLYYECKNGRCPYEMRTDSSGYQALIIGETLPTYHGPDES